MLTLTGNPVVDGLLVAGGLLTALGLIWRKFLRPIIHIAYQAEEILPVVLTIATEFKANGGASLRDAIDSIAASTAEQVAVLSDYAHTARHDLVDKFTAVRGHQDLLSDKVDDLDGKVERLSGEVAEIKQFVDRRNEPQGTAEDRRKDDK